MSIYRIANNHIHEIEKTTFEQQGMKERADLQNMLKSNIGVISPDNDILVVAEEFGNWEDSRRRIDLLGIDKNANLIVMELKRTEDGGHMELQAIRYAAMISTLTFDDLVSAYSKYLQDNGDEEDSRENLLNFLEWEEPDKDKFGQDVKIILASADFSKELTTSVMWLYDSGLDIQCVRIQPYENNGEILLDVQSIIPLPEAAEFQVRIREKKQQERESRRVSNRDYTKYDVSVGNESHKGLNKRWAMFHLISGVLHQNPPREVVEKIENETQKKLFRTFPGKLNIEEVSEKLPPNYHARYFLGEENEIFHIDDETYLLTNQWGQETEDTAQTIKELLRELLPELNIEFERAN